MRHVNYKRWAHYLTDLFLKADIPVKKVLDIACGTGSLLLNLVALDYEGAGFDSSENMIRLAREKARKSGLQIPFWQGMMWNFKVKRPFHACICTYDSMNYCMDLEQCCEVFVCASEALCPGGIFIFDICTERNSRNFFQNYYEKDGTENFNYIRQSFYIKKESLQINEFIIFLESNASSPFREIHRQRIYRINELRELIPGEHFKLVGIYDGFSNRPGTEKSNRVHFVVKKV